VLGRHLFEEIVGFVFVEDVYAVADALGVAEVDGFADVEGETFWRDHALREFAGMEGDVDLRIDGVEVVEHLHLKVIVLHGDAAVFGHDKVEADDVGIGGGYFKAEEGLREDLLRWEAAEDLVEPVDFDDAHGRRIFHCTTALNEIAMFLSRC